MAVILVVSLVVPVASVSNGLPAPELVAPIEDAVLDRMGVALEWKLPPKTTQVHVQVMPANNDGPAIDLLLGPESLLRVPEPPEWYGLLPDMTYTWRVRVSDGASPGTRDEVPWSPWVQRRFRTPAVSGATVRLAHPRAGAIVATRTPSLQWSSDRSDVFYYELQLSRDPEFGEGLLGAWRPIYWVLVHGGLTDPPNSYTLPPTGALEDNTQYYWRMRPRVQGDGQPVGWSFTFHFQVVTAAGRATPTPTPTSLPGPTGKLAFVSSRDGNPEIYAAFPDGSGWARLTSNPAVDLEPVWSPDGTQIAFTSNRTGKFEVYTMGANGASQARLTKDESGVARVAWSPDGSRIAFWRFQDEFPNTDIFVMRIDGSDLIRLTWDPFSDTSPVWSPDGSRIAFVSGRDGNLEVYIMNTDGSGQSPLTNHPSADTQPAWSPEGTRIAFVSARDRNAEIYVMDGDGRSQRRLTRTPREDQQPTWSPTQRLIAYECGFGLCVIDDDGNRSPWFNRRFGSDPTWSPDGRKIAYECQEGICTMDADTGLEKVLPGSLPGDFSPQWSRR